MDNRIAKTYSLLALQALVTAITVYLLRQNNINLFKNWWFLLPFALSFFIIYLIMQKDYSIETKILLLCILAICLGSMSIAVSKLIPITTIETSFVTTFILFMVMSIVGYIFFKLNISLQPLSFILFFALIGLIISTIAAILFDIRSTYIFVAGFVIFSLYIAADTNRMISSPVQDPVLDALGLYLDIINLFQNILGFSSN